MNATLEKEILASPDSADVWAVYGDWLASQGDVRGELVAVQQARARASGAELARLLVAEDNMLAASATHFFGPLARSPKKRRAYFDWENGFISAIECSVLGNELAVLSHPSARFVRRMRHAEVHAPPPLLHSMRTFQDDASALLAHEPLRSLELLSPKLALSELRHCGLERLYISWARGAVLKALAAAELPRLIELRLGSVVDAHDALVAVEHLNPRLLEIQYNGLGDFSHFAPIFERMTTLSVHGGQSNLAALARHTFRAARQLKIASTEPVATFFDAVPDLPALEEITLWFPTDSVRFFRAFARSSLARTAPRLSVGVRKPAAGLALVDRQYEALEHLELEFDATLSAEFLESRQLFARDVFPRLRSLSLRPTRHVPALAESPIAARLIELRLLLDDEEDAKLWLQHRDRFPRLESLSVGGIRRLSHQALEALCTSVPRVIWEPFVALT